MAEIFHIDPEYERRIHPHALKRLNEWRAELLHEVPQLKQLSIDEVNIDVNAHLTEDEKAKVHRCRANLMEYIGKCMDIADDNSPNPYSTEIIHPMSELKSLVKKAYERKLEKQRREAALEALSPPLSDAMKCLNLQEYQDFEATIPTATDAYRDKGEYFVSDRRAVDYLWWCSIIRKRLKEKERAKIAERRLWEYNHSLNEEIKKLKAMLYPEKQNPENYFEKEVVDFRYMGQDFMHLLPDEEKGALRTNTERIIPQLLSQLVPDNFSQFVFWKSQTHYFLSPSADYSFNGVACLDFSFDVFAVVESAIWLKPAKRSFDGYVFSLPWIEDKGYSVLLKEPKLLGYRYSLLTPSKLGNVFWQRIPMVLLQGLMNGEGEPAGTIVVEASEGETTYTVDDFEGEVTIPDSFAGYLRNIGGIDGMVTIGIVSEKVGDIAARKLGRPETKEKSKLPENGEHSGFRDDELIVSLTGLGVPAKDAKNLLELTPRNLALPEAIKVALKKHSEIIAQRHSSE